VSGDAKNGNGAIRYEVLGNADDSDRDGIINREEIKWGLNPKEENGDSDNDGFSDKIEANNGFDPLNRDDNPATVPVDDALAVTDGQPGTRDEETGTFIRFTTEGYAVGTTANVYYQVVAAGAKEPELKDYWREFGALSAGPHDKLEEEGTSSGDDELKVEGIPPNEWMKGYYVYVVIMQDRKVSRPASIYLPPKAEIGAVVVW
jgi:hypothetical protein